MQYRKSSCRWQHRLSQTSQNLTMKLHPSIPPSFLHPSLHKSYCWHSVPIILMYRFSTPPPLIPPPSPPCIQNIPRGSKWSCCRSILLVSFSFPCSFGSWGTRRALPPLFLVIREASDTFTVLDPVQMSRNLLWRGVAINTPPAMNISEGWVS